MSKTLTRFEIRKRNELKISIYPHTYIISFKKFLIKVRDKANSGRRDRKKKKKKKKKKLKNKNKYKTVFNEARNYTSYGISILFYI